MSVNYLSSGGQTRNKSSVILIFHSNDSVRLIRTGWKSPLETEKLLRLASVMIIFAQGEWVESNIICCLERSRVSESDKQ